jgi:hypothetical protein
MSVRRFFARTTFSTASIINVISSVPEPLPVYLRFQTYCCVAANVDRFALQENGEAFRRGSTVTSFTNLPIEA